MGRSGARREGEARLKANICVLPGDGIGVEVIDATLPVLEKAAKGFSLEFRHYPGRGAALSRKPAMRCPKPPLRPRRRPTRSCSAPWAGRRSAIPTAPRSRRSSTCGFVSSSTPACGRCRAIPGVPLPLADARAKDIDLVVVRESTEGLFASRGKGKVEADRDAHDTMVITRRGPSACTSSRFASPRRAAAEAPRDLRGQGERVRLDGVLPQGLRRGRAAPPRIGPSHRLHRRHRAQPGAQALGLRRAGDREHVRRHPLRPGRRR